MAQQQPVRTEQLHPWARITGRWWSAGPVLRARPTLLLPFCNLLLILFGKNGEEIDNLLKTAKPLISTGALGVQMFVGPFFQRHCCICWLPRSACMTIPGTYDYVMVQGRALVTGPAHLSAEVLKDLAMHSDVDGACCFLPVHAECYQLYDFL